MVTIYNLSAGFTPLFFAFTGASGTGKSTLIEQINGLYDTSKVLGVEISARQFLPNTGSYDQTLTDELQALIVQHRTLTIMEALLTGLPYKIFSRGPLDNWAYSKVLKKGIFLEPMSEREINILKKHLLYLYIPIEFEMVEKDEVRGNNIDVQVATDEKIRELLFENKIPHVKITGSVEERMEIIKELIEIYFEGVIPKQIRL